MKLSYINQGLHMFDDNGCQKKNLCLLTEQDFFFFGEILPGTTNDLTLSKNKLFVSMNWLIPSNENFLCLRNANYNFFVWMPFYDWIIMFAFWKALGSSHFWEGHYLPFSPSVNDDPWAGWTVPHHAK